MALTTTLAAQAPARRWVELLGRRPGLPALAASAVAWVVLLRLVAPVQPASGGHGPHAPTTHPEAGEVVLDAGRGLLVWVLMVVAMMLPLAVPGIRYVARMVPRRGRVAATSTFAGAYVVAWLPLGVLTLGLHGRTAATWPVVAAAFLLAAAWELAPAKRTALLRCHRHQVVRARQPARRHSCWAFGMRRGAWCVATCGPAMVALAVTAHAVVPLLVVTAGAWLQQLTVNAHWHRQWSAAALAALALTAPLYL